MSRSDRPPTPVVPVWEWSRPTKTFSARGGRPSEQPAKVAGARTRAAASVAACASADRRESRGAESGGVMPGIDQSSFIRS